MNSGEPNLDVVQRWMLSVITHPQGIEAGIASPDAQQEIDVSPEQIAEVIQRSRACTSLERLAVYGNAYIARLIECLAAEFPALQHAVGEEVFATFVVEYLQRFPSRSYTLAKLGAEFPRYLDETRPTRDDESSGPDSPEFLVDLATLERIYSDVFDGPGEEEQPPFSVERLKEIPGAQWDAIRLETSASLKLITCRFPVHEYITAVRHEQSPKIPAAAPTWLAVHRREYIVRRHALTELQFQLLWGIQKGLPLGEAIESAVASQSHIPENLTVLIEAWFRDWTAAGYFQGVCAS